MPARCFLAFDLPEPTLALLARVHDAFVAEAPAWKGERWVRPELQHVTVKFVGALDDTALPDAERELTLLAAGSAPFELRLSAIRAVRSAGRASMLWAEFAGDVEAGVALADRIDALLAGHFGVDADDRPHRPHVTLARTRRPRRAPLPALEAATAVLEDGKDLERVVSVPSVTLLSSTLSPQGPTYQTLAEFKLGG